MAQVVELDASGDIIIELSSQSSEKTHLLVSSKVLTLLSPVLGKVFEWESRARADGEKGGATPVIPLPDDDAEVFTIICHIAHHKMEGIPDILKPEALVKFAEICKKYDCIRSFTHSSFRWLQLDSRPYSSLTDLNKLLYAAYTLNIGDAFEKISRRILFHQRGSFSTLPGFPNHGLDHAVIIAQFSDRRIKLVNDLMDVMLSPLNKPLDGSCDQSTMMIGRYLKELRRLGVWPRFELYFLSVFEVLHREIAEPIRQSCDSISCRFCSKRDFKFADELRRAKAAFVQKNDGLCLDSMSHEE